MTHRDRARPLFQVSIARHHVVPVAHKKYNVVVVASRLDQEKIFEFSTSLKRMARLPNLTAHLQISPDK